MKIEHVVHRLFLISMFIVCAVSVVSFMKQFVNAQNLTSGSFNTSIDTTVGVVVKGVCSNINGTRSIIEPTTNFCLAGEKTGFMDTGSTWRWYCRGTNGGESATCSVTKIIPELTAVRGTCSNINGTSVATEPTTNFCATGTQVDFRATSSGWSWYCKGINNGESVPCGVTKTIQTTTTISSAIKGVCSNINGTKVSTMPTTELCLAGTKTNPTPTSLGWSWYCKGINGGTTASCSVIKYIQETTNANTATTTAAAISTSRDTEINNTTETILKKEEATQIAEVPVLEKEVVAQDNVVIAQQESIGMNQAATENFSQDDALVSDDEVATVSEVIIEAQNLLQTNNPKISGVVDDFLKIEHVQLNQKEGGDNRISLAGKAQPDAWITIYIFSDDPIVIRIKTDANGNWNYELNKELADGKHEAYVTVTSDRGEVISKSEPIAFVKTAQATTMIPVSESTANQSPIERSAQQYILIAIMIMMACLVVALSLIGFLNHRYNLDEGIN